MDVGTLVTHPFQNGKFFHSQDPVFCFHYSVESYTCFSFVFISSDYSVVSIGYTMVWWLLVLCLWPFLLQTVMVGLCACPLSQFLSSCIPVMLFLLAGAPALSLVVMSFHCCIQYKRDHMPMSSQCCNQSNKNENNSTINLQ